LIIKAPFTIVAATLALAAAVPLHAARAADVTPITLRSGHSIILETPGLSRVGVGDRDIAGVVPLGNSEVVINGKTTGRTTVFVWAKGRHTTYEVTVTEQSMDDLARMLRSSLTFPGVELSTFDHSVVVNGTVPSLQDSLRIDDVLTHFQKVAEANKYTLVNAVAVSQPLGDLQPEVSKIAGVEQFNVDRDGKGNLIVSGRVTDESVAENVVSRVRAHAGAYLAADGKIIDRLALDTTTQVDVKVYILEVDRTAQSQLGIRMQSGVPDPNHPGFYILSSPSFPALETPVGVGRAITTGGFFRTTVLAPTLDLILNTGHARVLSSPDLVTMPGQQATFLVGGQIPIPYASGPGQIAIEYKDFGVSLKMTPTILGNGSVETVIAPEVSDLDFSDGIQVSGFNIPALKVSRLATDVVTKSGESVVMGGLLRRLEQRNINKIPLLGDIPILGQLFRSTSYQKSETDLVFVMTPQVLVR
jgi:pilus assembly protein CpaC